MPNGDRLGDIVLDQDETMVRALWRSLDGSPEVRLCSIDRGCYERHPALREAFVSLAADIAINLNEPAGNTRTVQHRPAQPAEARIDRTKFGCWGCAHPLAEDARQNLRSFDETELSNHVTPGGNLTFCCKVSMAAQFGSWSR